MKKTILTLCLAIPLSMSLSGCVISVDGDGSYSSWQHRENKNREVINNLSPGLVVRDVTDRMGTPDFSELYQKDNANYKVLYFRTQRRDGDGITTKDECTPVIFKDGILVGWGDSAFRNI